MKRKYHNEKGSISLEFLGILPFYFLFFLLLWQVVASGYAVMTAKTAVNDAAKWYAATIDTAKTKEVARQTIGSSSVLSYKDLLIEPKGNGQFTVKLQSSHSLIFIPDRWKDKTAIDLDMEVHGKVLVE